MTATKTKANPTRGGSDPDETTALSGADLLRGRIRRISVPDLGYVHIKAPPASLALGYTAKLDEARNDASKMAELPGEMAHLLAACIVDPETGEPLLSVEDVQGLGYDLYLILSAEIGRLLSGTYGAARELLGAPEIDPADVAEEPEPGEANGEGSGFGSPAASPPS